MLNARYPADTTGVDQSTCAWDPCSRAYSSCLSRKASRLHVSTLLFFSSGLGCAALSVKCACCCRILAIIAACTSLQGSLCCRWGNREGVGGGERRMGGIDDRAEICNHTGQGLGWSEWFSDGSQGLLDMQQVFRHRPATRDCHELYMFLGALSRHEPKCSGRTECAGVECAFMTVLSCAVLGVSSTSGCLKHSASPVELLLAPVSWQLHLLHCLLQRRCQLWTLDCLAT